MSEVTPQAAGSADKNLTTSITMFVNRMMYGGKRGTALAIMYDRWKLSKIKPSANRWKFLNRRCAHWLRLSQTDACQRLDLSGSVEVPMRATAAACAGAGTPANAVVKAYGQLSSELLDAASGQNTSIKKDDTIAWQRRTARLPFR